MDVSQAPINPASPVLSSPATPAAREAGPSGPVPSSGQAGPPGWARLHVWQIQPVRDLLILASLLGIVWLGYRLSIVTVPLLLALLLAYLVEPLVRLMTRNNRMRRPFAVLLLIGVSTLLLVVPTVLGLTFGVAQASTYAQQQLGNVQRLLKAVDQPDNLALREALPSHTWRSLRDWLIQQEAKAALQSAVEGARRGVRGNSSVLPPPTQAPPQADPATARGAGTTPVPVGQSGQTTSPEGREDSTGASVDAPRTTDADQATAPSEAEPFEFVSTGVAQVTTQVISWLRAHAGDIGARAVEVGAGALGTVGRVAGSFAGIVFGAFLTLFFFYFFSVSWPVVLQWFSSIVPRSRQHRVFALAQRMDRVIAGFIRGRLTICACQMVLFTLVYWLIGVPAPLIVGPLVGLLTLVPYAAALGMPVAMVLMALDPNASGDFRDAWWWIIIAPILTQVISQVLDDYVLTPRIQGKNTDMSMPMILFASIAGGVLAGVYGLLLAIPVAACAKILIAELVMPRVQAWAAGTAEDLLPIDRG